MTKFHINKHGVPTPCHAKQGNCPLGGDTGGENHFDTQEEAQAAVDKINEEEHSLLPELETKAEVFISEDSKAWLFGPSYHNHGYVDVGISTFNMQDEMLVGMGPDEKDPLVELREELRSKAPESLELEKATVIPGYNAEDYYKYHVMGNNTEEYDDNEHYVEMAKTVMDFSPESASIDSDGEAHIDIELERKITSFAANRTLEESNLTINGEKFFIGAYDSRNWAKEYFEEQ